MSVTVSSSSESPRLITLLTISLTSSRNTDFFLFPLQFLQLQLLCQWSPLHLQLSHFLLHLGFLPLYILCTYNVALSSILQQNCFIFFCNNKCFSGHINVFLCFFDKRMILSCIILIHLHGPHDQPALILLTEERRLKPTFSCLSARPV